MRIDHGGGIRPHAAGPDRMENGGAYIPGGPDQLGLALKGRAGLEFFRPERGQRGLSGDLARQADGLGRDLFIGLCAQIIRRDGRLLAKIGGLQMDAAPALGPQVADAGGEGREGVQRVAEPFQRQGLHMIFQVRRFI